MQRESMASPSYSSLTQGNLFTAERWIITDPKSILVWHGIAGEYKSEDHYPREKKCLFLLWFNSTDNWVSCDLSLAIAQSFFMAKDANKGFEKKRVFPTHTNWLNSRLAKAWLGIEPATMKWKFSIPTQTCRDPYCGWDYVTHVLLWEHNFE